MVSYCGAHSAAVGCGYGDLSIPLERWYPKGPGGSLLHLELKRVLVLDVSPPICERNTLLANVRRHQSQASVT